MTTRTPYQGVFNVVRFNWPFYAAAAAGLGGALALGAALPQWRRVAQAAATVGAYATAASLAATHYVYDRSDLHRWRWLGPSLAATGFRQNELQTVVSVGAGFDETSEALAARYPSAKLRVLDFYDPARHTEPSIARARRAYPPYPGTQSISAVALPLADASVSLVLAMLSAHEVRDPVERVAFLLELRRVLAPGGRLLIVEHLRNAPNLAAYGPGAFHFHSRGTWLSGFARANLQLLHERKITPFITAFTLGRSE